MYEKFKLFRIKYPDFYKNCYSGDAKVVYYECESKNNVYTWHIDEPQKNLKRKVFNYPNLLNSLVTYQKRLQLLEYLW